VVAPTTVHTRPSDAWPGHGPGKGRVHAFYSSRPPVALPKGAGTGADEQGRGEAEAREQANQWRCYSVSRRRLMPCSSAARRLAALNLPKPHQPTDSRCSSAAACPSGKERAAGSTLRSEIAEPRRANWQLRRMSAFRATPPDRAPGHARHPRIRGTKLPGARGDGTWKRSESLGPGATLLRTARHVYVCMYYNDRYTAKPGMGV
jgi:hypothetical protein